MDDPDSFTDKNGGMWQLLVDSVVDYAIYLLDLDGTIKSWNAGAQRIKGYSAKEIIGSNFSRFYTGEDIRAGAPARSLAIARSVGRFEAQGWRVRKDGTRLWADVVIDVVRNPAGEVVGFAKVTRDITQRALRPVTKDDDGTGKVLVDNILDYAVFLLDLDGTVKSWNAGAERIKGYSAQQIIGSNFSVFFTADDVSAGEPIRCLEIARTTGRFEGTGCRVRKDGKRVRVNVVIDVVRDAAGAVVGFANVTRDLTQSAALRAATEENGSIAQTLVDNVVDYAIYLLDLDGTVKSWNAGAQRIKGYSAEEVIGRNFGAFYTDDDVRAGEPVRSLAIARATGKFAAEGWRVRKDRTRLWASVVIDAVRDPTGEVVGFAKVTRDITQSAAVHYLTEQLRVEREQFLVAKRSADEAIACAIESADRDRVTAAKLLEQNRLMTMAEEMVKVGYWRLDLRTQEVHWSDEVYRIHDWHQSRRPTLETVLASYHNDDRQRVTETIERAIYDGTSYGFEARIVRPDGTERMVVANGQVVREDDGTISGLFGAIQDITERRDAEHERERLIVRVGLATQAARVGIWDWDFATNAIVWDPMMFALYGFDDAQFSPVYESWTGALHPNDRARAEREIAHAAETGTSFETEFRIVWPDGEVHHIQARATVVCDAAGTAQRMIGTNWDITEVRTLAAQLSAAAERARAAAAAIAEKNRLMAMAEQMAHVAHWRIDVLTNELIWSDELYSILGWPKSRPPVLESAIESYHPDDRPNVRDSVGRALQDGTPLAFEARIAHADGNYRDVICSGQAERAEDGAISGIVGVFQDVTERKEIERERERLTLRVGLATQSARVGIWDWDMAANSILCDPIMHTLYGFAEADFFPGFETWLAAVHDDDRERVSQELTQAASSHVPFASEFRVVWPNADVHHIRAMGTVIYSRCGIPERMIGTNWDVTEVRTLNAQLQQEKEAQERLTARVNLATSAAQVGIWEWDVRTGAVEWDPIMYRIFGVDPAQGPATYQTWAATLHADDRERAEGELAQAAASGPMFESEFRVVWPGGQVRNTRAVAVIVRDAAGAAERMIGTNWDVTEARTLATQLAAAAEHDRATAATLRETNGLMAMAEQISQVGTWRLDVRSRVMSWSNEVYRIFALPTTLQPTLEISMAASHPDDRAEASAAAAHAIAAGTAYKNESRIIRPDGTIRHLVFQGEPESDSDGTIIAFIGMCQDVTELKEADRERLRLLERVRVAAQAGNVGIWEWNLGTDGVVWDPTMFALYGLSEQVGPQTAKLWKRAFHPEDEEPTTRAIVAAIHGRTLLDVEYRVLWPNGETHYLRCRGMVTAEAGDPVRMLGTAWDITEVRRLAIQLQEEKERLLTERAALLTRTTELRELLTLQRAILTDAAVGIIATDIDGTITLFNPAAERMLGYSAEEIVGRTTPAPFHDRAEVEARAAALTTELGTMVEPGFEVFIVKAWRGVSDSNEWTYIRKDGTRFPVLLSATALRDDDDNVFGYLGMVVDQTELQSEKKRLLETVDMWMAAKQVADDATRAKSNFLANMSHEIRTPMNGIIGLTSLLLDVDLAPEHEAHLKLIADAGLSLLAIINDILDLSKVEAGKIDLEAIPLSPAGVVRGALALVRGEALKKAIALDITIAPDVPDWVNGDPTRLRQILLNLLSNAIKFTERGRVGITVRREPQTGRDALRFEISDTGIGIAPESRHLLFEKFSQVDRSDARKFGGSGLGLAISRRLAEAMSGTIGVTSEVGAGSVFWFTAQLPMTAPPAKSAVAARRRTDVVARRILLVDDNPLNQIVARAMLEKDGHDVIVAVDGREALAAVQERSFDLVLMDMQMPVMDGMEATRRIRDLDTGVRDIPIVALTANVMAEEIASCCEAGMNDHLAKPIDRDQLRQIIATWATTTDSHPPTDPKDTLTERGA